MPGFMPEDVRYALQTLAYNFPILQVFSAIKIATYEYQSSTQKNIN